MHKEWKAGFGDGRVIAGVFVTAVGVVFLLNNLGIIEARSAMRVWLFPMALIAIGLAQLLRRGQR